MSKFIVLLAALLLQEICINALTDNVKLGHITQKLDHFDEKNERTYRQYYWVNDKFHRPGGPAFLYLEGEGPTTENKIDSEAKWQITNLAEKYGALVFSLEHRYFGRSIPIDDFSTENMRWLHSRQALEDAAHFIRSMHSYYNINQGKWVVFGGSYAGSLSAWMRKVHPELVAGSISSSGPMQAIVNAIDYMKVVNESFWNHSPKCVQEISKAFRQVEQMLTTPAGRVQLKRKFNMCSIPAPNMNKMDMGQLFGGLQDIFQGIAQYGGDNRGEYAFNKTIPRTCSIMQDSLNFAEPVDRLALLSLANENQRRKPTNCLEIRYEEEVKRYRLTNPYTTPELKDRGWLYICCAEMGWFQTTDHPLQPFGNHTPLDWSLQQCLDVFGETMTRANLQKSVHTNNEFYGGKKYKGSNVVLLNGSQDPASSLGICESAPYLDADVVFMKGAAHCADMYPSKPVEEELESVLEARAITRRNIDKWLQL